MSDFDLSTLMSCNYGTSVFMVENMSVDEEPVVKEGQGRTATKVQIDITGYIAADDPADLTTALSGAYANLAIDGLDLVVAGIGGSPLLTLYAAWCSDGGPHVKFHVEPSAEPLRMDFKISVQATFGGIQKDGKMQPADTWKLETKVRPDTLQEITRTGEVNGPSAGSYFLSTVLSVFEAAFPGPNWVTEFGYSTSGDGNKTKAAYRTSARQVASPLPSSTLAEAVDGDSSVRIERDEQMKLITTYEYDLVVVGSMSDLLTNLRGTIIQQAKAAGGIIWKEATHATYIREQRLRATFVTIQGGDTVPIVGWQQSLSINRNNANYEVKVYAGADPVVVQRPNNVERLTQSGSATCVGNYLKAPPPRYFSLLEPEEVTYEDLGDGVQFRTTWKYVMYTAGAGDGGDGNETGGAEGSDPSPSDNPLTPASTPFDETGFGLQFLGRHYEGTFIKVNW